MYLLYYYYHVYLGMSYDVYSVLCLSACVIAYYAQIRAKGRLGTNEESVPKVLTF